MRKIDYSGWDDIETVVEKINEVTLQISQAMVLLEKHGNYVQMIYDLFDNLESTLDYWTGNTYVGIEKEEELKNAYQGLFECLFRFVLLCQKVSDPVLNDFAKSVLFQGTVYRYLGHGFHDESITQRIIPRYDGIFVSWSKVPQNTYLENKLYGTITKLTCLIDNEYYGIDLEPFGVVRGDESEVVFPTIEQTIKSIEYIEDEDSTFQ